MLWDDGFDFGGGTQWWVEDGPNGEIIGVTYPPLQGPTLSEWALDWLMQEQARAELRAPWLIPGVGGGEPPGCSGAGYDTDGNGQNDPAPQGVQDMRSAINAAGDQLRSRSFENGGLQEAGAFVFRDLDGQVRLSSIETSGSYNRINEEALLRMLADGNRGDVITGFVHTHFSGTGLSYSDLVAISEVLYSFALENGLSVDDHLMAYVYDFESGRVTEWSSEAIHRALYDEDGNRRPEAEALALVDQTGQAVSNSGVGGCGGS